MTEIPEDQIRRALDRFAGITDVTFLPFDQRAADAALLHARPMADVTPRSALVAAVRRFAEHLEPKRDGAAVTAGSLRGSSRAARWLRPARAVQHLDADFRYRDAAEGELEVDAGLNAETVL